MEIHEYLDKYRKGYVKKSREYDKLEYYSFEKDFMNHINSNKFSLIKKSRQIHATTLLANYVSWLLIFNGEINIAYVSPNRASNTRFLNLVNESIRNFNFNITPRVNNTREIRLNNDSTIFAMSDNINNLCGKSLNILIFDEAAHLKNFNEFYEKATFNMESDFKIIVNSTPKSCDRFHYIYEDSIRGKNDYKSLTITTKDKYRSIYGEDYLEKYQYFESEMKKYASEDTFINEVLAEFTFWKPKKNKTVKLQVRVSEETLNKMFGPMNKKGFTDYSKYIRDLIIKDVDN
jgi:hypothetical protein